MTSPINYPLAISTWDESDVQAAVGVIQSRNTTMGRHVKDFEKKFSEFLGVNNTLMVNSGSSANLLMASVLRQYLEIHHDQRNTIIIPAVGWSTSYAPFVQLGFEVLICDVDLESFNISINDCQQQLSADVVAILAVNILGNPCELDKLDELCQENEIFLLEDNCESLGATLNSKKAGSYGAMSSHSFFYSHHINTMEGGSLSTSNPDMYLLALILRNHGWSRDVEVELSKNVFHDSKITQFLKSQISLNTDDFQKFFYFIFPGFNLRPTEIQGALGLVQIQKLDDFILNRRKNYLYLKMKLSQNDFPLSLQSENGVTSSFGFGIVLKSNISRGSLYELLTSCGIQSRPIVCGNIMKAPLGRYFKCTSQMKYADVIHDNGLYIGNSHVNGFESIDYLINVLGQFFKGSED